MPYKKTSSFTERRQRGAVFIEAIVVISALTLGLLALVYIRDLYVKQLGVSRLARAAVIAHSMAGCKTNQPRDWLGRDTAGYTASAANRDQQSAAGKNGGSTPSTSGGRAGNLIQKAGGSSADGKGMLNPITDTQLAGQASASAKASPLGRSQSAFSGRVRATSFVSCGDEVKDGDFDRIMGVMKDEIWNLIGK